jgi:hypothetical protein
MVCQEVVFSKAVCRIEIEPRPYALKGPSFAALLYVIDGGDAIHPVMFRDGRRVEVHAQSEALALNSAVALLEEWFGVITEPAHGCQEGAISPRIAEPLILQD